MKQERMTPEQYRNMPGKRKNKYNAKKIYVDGHTFDSKKEYQYYQQLMMRKRTGEIKDFKLQPKFTLQEGFKKNGETYRKVSYIADFKVLHNDGSIEIVDVKSPATQKDKTYRLKKRLFEYKYPDLSITEVL